jgi:hypothetical protein
MRTNTGPQSGVPSRNTPDSLSTERVGAFVSLQFQLGYPDAELRHLIENITRVQGQVQRASCDHVYVHIPRSEKATSRARHAKKLTASFTGSVVQTLPNSIRDLERQFALTRKQTIWKELLSSHHKNCS